MPAPVTKKTLYDKVWDLHVVKSQGTDGTCILYIDRHIVHEVTSPQAFEGLTLANRPVRRKDCTLVTVDHNIPTESRKNFKDASSFIKEADSRLQCVTLEENVKAFGLTYFGMTDKRQGIVHVIGPEQGFTLPGTTVVCGDSHTATHGAFGALAFGIGTSEVEHVLATQTIIQKKAKNMRIKVDGKLTEGVTSKDIILHIIGVIGTAGGNGSAIEYCGTAIEDLSMEARMSICNMSIEAGARAGMIAPDDNTFKYLEGRPLAPKGADWDAAVAHWKTLRSDEGAHFDVSVEIDAKDIQPTVTWGTSPQDVVHIGGVVPNPDDAPNEARKTGIKRSLEYMNLTPGTKMEEVKIDKVFIGSCTNSRIEDLRSAARVVRSRKVASHVYAMVVPGSGLVKKQAEAEGIDQIFKEAGFDWREAGCSMCLGMNPDQLRPGERCASTSNRNFEGRQGPGGRTHLMSPAMAAAAAIEGRLADVRKLVQGRSGDDILPSSNSGRPASPVEADTDSLQEQALAAPVEKTDTDPVEEGTDSVATSAGAPKNAVSAGHGASKAAGMPKFTQLKGVAAELAKSNVDTDAIIPARFLKTIKRTGLGSALFYSYRYADDAKTERPEFILNQPTFRNAKILIVTGPNFGCGSSREHAPWALSDFGLRSVICTSFADIFFNNCFKNGMLPIVLPQEQVDILAADSRDGSEMEVDLVDKVIRRKNGETIPFEVEDFRRHCLINGLDDISLTLEHEGDITKFEQIRSQRYPWLDGAAYTGKIPVKVEQKKMDW